MKKGFTLIELLVVIVLLGVLTTLVVPNVIDSYNKSVIKKMAIDEANVADAAEIYVNEHCIDPLYYKGVLYTCPTTYSSTPKYICLSELTNPAHGNVGGEFYIDSINFKGETCKGVIIIGESKYSTYLYCGVSEGGSYPYKTEQDTTVTASMKTACGIS